MASSPLTRFYLSCFVSSWGDRIWYFALSIYFVTINNNSLLVTALNGLCANLALITLGPYIGSLIDKHQRMPVITISLLAQNLTVALNCCIFVAIIIYRSTLISYGGGSSYLLYVVQTAMIGMNIVSKLASMACRISIERDWIIVIAKSTYDARLRLAAEENGHIDETENLNSSNNNINNNSKEQQPGNQMNKKEKSENEDAKFKHELTSINASVRRIDLITAIVSPLCAGLIMSFLNMGAPMRGQIVSALVFALWNIVSFVFEFVLLRSVYSSVPELEKPKVVKSDQAVKNGILQVIEKTTNGWSDYFSQGVVLIPSLALAFLFLTVLSFDGITVGYAKSQKLSEVSISLFQGVGSIMGVLGTIVFPLLHNKAKIELTYVGFVGSCLQLSFLFVCFVAIWLPGSPFSLADQLFSTSISKCAVSSLGSDDDENAKMTSPAIMIEAISDRFTSTNNKSSSISDSISTTSVFTTSLSGILFESSCQNYTSIVVLLSGMALSRFGLWLTDLVIHQIIQESVPESKRGLIGGVQSSLNTVFELIKFALVIFLSDTSQYGYLVIVSMFSVLTAFVFFAVYTVVMFTRRQKPRANENKKTKPKPDQVGEEMNELA